MTTIITKICGAVASVAEGISGHLSQKTLLKHRKRDDLECGRQP